MTLGGDGNLGWVPPKEWCDAISKRKRGKKRLPFSEEWKNALRQACKGRNFSEEHREKLRATRAKQIPPMLGKKHSNISKQKMKKNHPDFSGEHHPQYGTHQSIETIEKRVSKIRGRKHSEETKQKISDARKRFLASKAQ
jgi:hypothetical protein